VKVELEEKVAQKKFFLSVCFPQNGLSLEYLLSSSTCIQREKIEK
jgi:hypothetical protein